MIVRVSYLILSISFFRVILSGKLSKLFHLMFHAFCGIVFYSVDEAVNISTLRGLGHPVLIGNDISFEYIHVTSACAVSSSRVLPFVPTSSLGVCTKLLLSIVTDTTALCFDSVSTLADMLLV